MPDDTTRESQRQAMRRSLDEAATTFEPPSSPTLSSAEIDILSKECAQNIQLAIDAETHRSTVMTFIFTAAGALVYALASVKFSPQFWPIAVIVGVLGGFAALLADVYHERWEFYMTLATGYRRRIAAAVPGARLEEILSCATAVHQSKFTRRLPLYVLWKYLALGISVTGFVCAAVMVIVDIGWLKLS
jgi:hypothetical protein